QPQPHTPILILIAGPPCSGKKSVLNALKSKLDSLSHRSLNIAILHLRDFHVPAEDSASVGGERERDMECLASPASSSSPSSSSSAGVIPEIILCEGHYLLHPPLLSHNPPLSPLIIKIYTETSPDVRLARRVLRDSSPPHCLPLEHIFDTHVRFGKPAAEAGITPTKVLADIILPKGAEGPGVELIAHGVLVDL
ncbi:hypothetical protein EV426DRAFT_521115, partial [Tirmania nivea]